MKILRYSSTMFKDKYPGILLSQTVIFCSLYFKCFFKCAWQNICYHFIVENEGSSEKLFDVNLSWNKFILTCGLKSNNDPSGWVAILPIGEKLTEKDSALDGIRTHASQILTGRCY